MAISVRASGTWTNSTTQNPTVTIPGSGSYVEGDLGILVSVVKPFGTTTTIDQDWTEIIDTAAGSTGNGNGTGSVQLYVAYKVFTSASEANPTLTRSGSVSPEQSVIIVLQKSDTTARWGIDAMSAAVEQAMGTTAMSHVATTTRRIDVNDLIFALTGVGDDSATFTRATTAISGGPTWSGNVVEYPATHGSGTAGFDGAGDLIYRVASSSVASGQSITITATLSAAERVGSILFFVREKAVGLAQAQAFITAAPIDVFAQSQAQIKQTDRAYAQAGSKVYTGLGTKDALIRNYATATTVSTASSLVVPLPASLQQGDLIVVFTYWDNTGTPRNASTAPTNWTAEDGVTNTQTGWKSYRSYWDGIETEATFSLDGAAAKYGGFSVAFTNGAANTLSPGSFINTAGTSSTLTVGDQDASFSTYYQVRKVALLISRDNVTFSDPTPDNPYEILTNPAAGLTGALYDYGTDYGTSLTTLSGFTIEQSVSGDWQTYGLYIINRSTPPLRPYAQAQARIAQTYNVYAQAQAQIKTTNFVVAQANAQISIRTSVRGQAAAMIFGLYPLPVLDTFTRSESNSLGSPGNGDTWVRISGTASNVQVNGSQATFTALANGQHIYDLPLTYADLRFPQGFEAYFEVSLDTIPLSGSQIVFVTITDSRDVTNPSGNGHGARATFSSSPDVSTTIGGPNTFRSGPSLSSYSANTFYAIKFQIIPASGNVAVLRYKLWELSQTEPGWGLDTFNASIFNPLSGHIRFAIQNNSNTTITTTIDNFSVSVANITRHAQVQARIKNTYFTHAQAQAYIATNHVITYQHSQARAQILSTANVHGQAQARVMQIYSGSAQAQGQILTTNNNTHAQAQARILTPNSQHGQAQTQIKQSYNNHAQASAQINQSYNVYAQAQAQILATSNAHSQAQVRIKNTTNVFAQAQAEIALSLFTYEAFAQAQARIVDSYEGLAQAQAWIKSTEESYAQSQARILAVDNKHGQAQASINTSYTLVAQAQAQILVTTSAHAQAQAQILTGYNSYAQANAWIENTYQVFAQAQAWIEAVGYTHSQAQAQILQTYAVYAQVQGQIKQTYSQVAQAQARITQAYNNHANTQAQISQTYAAFAQANAQISQAYTPHAQSNSQIKQTYNVHVQAQGQIKTTYNVYAQALASIQNTYEGYAQAQAWIEVAHNQPAQALAKINAFDVSAYAQAVAYIAGQTSCPAQVQAQIKAAGHAHSQAQAQILQSYVAHAQAQAQVQQTYSEVSQAQAQITQTYNNHANTQAQIKVTTSVFAQSQAQIVTTYNAHAQVQAQIKVTANQVSQAQAKISAFGIQAYAQARAVIVFTGSAVHAQAQATIKAIDVSQSAQVQAQVQTTTSVHTQAQGRVKATSFTYAQAQAIIVSFVQVYAQAQVTILAQTSVHAQAVVRIEQTYSVVAQGQAFILTSVTQVAQAQAYIKVTNIEAAAQAQATIKTSYNQHAQVQGRITQSYNRYANAQAILSTSVISNAQAQASIKQITNGYAQAQAIVKTSNNKHAQSQARILTEGNVAPAQAAASIIKSAGYAQARAYIYQSVYIYTLTIGDRLGFSVTAGDILGFSVTSGDRTETLVAEDRTYDLTIGDRLGFTVTAGDRNFD